MRRLVSALALVPLLAAGACATDDELGQAELRLTAQSRTGQPYRLVHADLAISGPESLVLHTDDDPTRTRLDFHVQAGDYGLVLNPGWSLERLQPDGTAIPVNATLTSPSPLAFRISDGGFTPITLSFKVAGDVIDFGEGDGGISIDVDDGPAEPPRILFSAFSVFLLEGGSYDVLVSLSSPPVAPGVVEVLVGAPGIAVSPSALQFSADNYRTPQAVRISAPIDPDSNPTSSSVILRLAGSASESVSVFVVDTTTQGLQLTQTSMTMDEGTSATNSVRLLARPEQDVTVNLMGDGMADVSPQVMTFTPDDYDQPKSFTITAPRDSDTAPSLSHVVVRASDSIGEYFANLDVQIVDRDTAEPQRIIVEGPGISVDEGGTLVGTVRLATDPQGPVHVVFSTGSALLTTDRLSVDFDASNWSQPQPVVLRALEDDNALDEVVAVSAFAAGLPTVTLAINVIDNDRP